MAPVVVGGAPQSFGDFYPLEEQTALALGRRTSERPTGWGITLPPRAVSYTPPTLTMPSPPDAAPATEAYPMVLNRPRKLSSASTMSAQSSSKDSVDSRNRSPSPSLTSRTTFASIEANMNNPYSWRSDLPYHLRPAPRRPFKPARQPGELFSALPGEVLELFLDALKRSHLAPGSESCATCWMRDLCSLSLASRKWYKFARTSLYEDIQITGSDSPAMKKRYKPCPAPRLLLLRRTLRSNPQIAAIVHTLQVPSIPLGTPEIEYNNIVATVIMACPNFERLIGLYPRYSHEFERIFHALNTRPRLKQMDWLVESSPYQRQHRLELGPGKDSGLGRTTRVPLLTPGELLQSQSAAFLDFHSNWSHLTTLTIHALPGGTLTPCHLVSTVISRLPSLQHLHLSHMPLNAFTDRTLVELQPLKTLTLNHVPGVSSAGVSAFASRSTSRSLTRLVLRHVNVDSMAALARIFAHLTELQSFAFVQAFPPLMPEGSFICLMPYLASPSVRRIHWDITSHPHCANIADSILARSIAADGFPALQSIRTPNDPEGLFQGLCRPAERVDMPSDRSRSGTSSSMNSGGGGGMPIGLGILGGRSSPSPFQSGSLPGTPLSGSFKPPRFNLPGSPSSPRFPPMSPRFPPDVSDSAESSDLHKARLAAQARLESATQCPRFFVNVVDEDGTLVDKFGLGGFIGSLSSRIRYELQPDSGTTDETGGLASTADILEDRGEELGREGCTGQWRLGDGQVDKKERERVQHTERTRWRAVEL